MSAANIDARARAAREAFELAVARKDEPATLVAGEEMLAVTQADPDYRILALIPAQRAEPPRPIVTTFDQACARCRAEVKRGSTAWWAPGSTGVTCKRCGGGR